MTNVELLLGSYGIPVPIYPEASQQRPREAEPVNAPMAAPRELTLQDQSVEVAFFLNEAVTQAPYAVRKHYPTSVVHGALDKVARAIVLRTIFCDTIQQSVKNPEFASEETFLQEPTWAFLDTDSTLTEPAIEKDAAQISTGELPDARYIPDFEDDNLGDELDDEQIATVLQGEQERLAREERANQAFIAAQKRRAAAMTAAMSGVHQTAKAKQTIPGDNAGLTPVELEEKERELEIIQANLVAAEQGATVKLGRRERAFILDACREYDHVRCQVAYARRHGLHNVDLEEIARQAAAGVVDVPIETILHYEGLRSKASVFAGRVAARMSKSTEVIMQGFIEAAEYLGQSDVYLIQ